MSITDERYVSLTSFRADGTPRPTPVWIAAGPDADTAVVITDPDSYKARRIRRDPRVTLRACDARGAVTDGAPVVSGTAVVADDGPVVDDAQARIAAKYGLQYRLISGVQRIGTLLRRDARASTGALVITLDTA